MVSIRASLGFTAAVLALVSVSACSKKPAEDTTTAAPTETAATEPAATNAAAPAADAKVAADNTDTLAGVKYASYTGDAASGEKAFAVCKTCHAVEAGKNMVGPSLHGLIGRHSGEIPGFSYSAANKGSGIVWSEAKLFQYLEAPQRIIPGTKMTYTGLKDPQKRADVIAYLKTQS
jgi:cytochrome c